MATENVSADRCADVDAVNNLEWIAYVCGLLKEIANGYAVVNISYVNNLVVCRRFFKALNYVFNGDCKRCVNELVASLNLAFWDEVTNGDFAVSVD